MAPGSPALERRLKAAILDQPRISCLRSSGRTYPLADLLRRGGSPFNRHSHNHRCSDVVLHAFDEFDLLDDLAGAFRVYREIPHLPRYVAFRNQPDGKPRAGDIIPAAR